MSWEGRIDLAGIHELPKTANIIVLVARILHTPADLRAR